MCRIFSLSLFAWDGFDYLGSLVVSHEFYRVFFSTSVKIVIGIFIEITLKSVDHPGYLNISTILILASHEYGLHCHLFLFFHQYLINISLQRKSAIFHLLWLNALLKPLLGSGIISSLASSLRVCGNTASCPVHGSCLWSLLHSFISSNRF